MIDSRISGQRAKIARLQRRWFGPTGWLGDRR